MAFKLSFSFFQYIVDPESMTGKSEKGVGKLISRTIVMLIALVGLPTILFGSGDGEGLVQRAQNAFLPMLPRVIFGISEDSGVSVSNGDNTEDISNAANTMAAYALGAFFAPSPDLDTVCPGKYANTPRITSLEQFISNVNLSFTRGKYQAAFQQYFTTSGWSGIFDFESLAFSGYFMQFCIDF